MKGVFLIIGVRPNQIISPCNFATEASSGIKVTFCAGIQLMESWGAPMIAKLPVFVEKRHEEPPFCYKIYETLSLCLKKQKKNNNKKTKTTNKQKTKNKKTKNKNNKKKQKHLWKKKKKNKMKKYVRNRTKTPIKNNKQNEKIRT